jgi:hypothetical protein
MSITLPPLPHPVMNAMLGDDWADLFTADQLRARDIEVARLVLEAAADWCKGRGHLVTADVLRSLEVRHHE